MRGRSEAYKISMLERRFCKSCGEKSSDSTGAQLCCMYTPQSPQKWCAWCGDDLNKNQFFCSKVCSDSYKDELLDRLRAKWPPKWAEPDGL